jgi:hypothetical protein
MPRKRYPDSYRVEFTGDAQGMEWEGEVKAMNKTQAVAIAAAKAASEGVHLSTATWIRCEWMK